MIHYYDRMAGAPDDLYRDADILEDQIERLLALYDRQLRLGRITHAAYNRGMRKFGTWIARETAKLVGLT